MNKLKFVSILYLFVQSTFTYAQNLTNAPDNLNNLLLELAGQISTNLPAEISKNKEMISVIANNNTIIFNYKYTVPVRITYESLLPKRKEMMVNWLSTICNGTTTKTLIEKGAIIKHLTTTYNGELLTDFEADKSICLNTGI